MQAMLRAAKRRFRRWKYQVRPAASFIYDAASDFVSSGVPLDPSRGQKILAFLADEGLVSPSRVSTVKPASIANIRLVHSDGYLDAVTDPGTLEAIFGVPIQIDQVDTILSTHRRMAGGTIQATRLALRTGRVAVNLGGGFHHATPDRGMGFCVFNDIAIAVRRLRARGFDDPIAVVDLDLHDGNGTRVIFADDPSVHTFSIHNNSWDDAPAVASTAISLGTGVDDDAYLEALREALPPVIDRHKPSLVIYLAGVDVAADDQIGDWRITSEGVMARDRFVMESLREKAPRAATAVVLGGGYGPRAWRYSARFFSWLISGTAMEPRDPRAVTFHAVSRLGPMLRDPELTKTSADSGDWSLSASDLPGLVGEAPDTRVLGHFTPHGMELILDRTGILAELRSRGFPSPTVEVTAEGGLAPTVRIFGDETRTQVVIEFRVDRNQRVIPGLEVLFVEWLLLQNPVGDFTADRPRLPGQDHPGLGMFGQIAGLLVAMTDALRLAGVAFLPANYYLAVLSRHHLRFAHPADQAKFEALIAVLGHLSLADASGALAGGWVRDENTGEQVQWEPAPMVIPHGDAMRKRVESPEYDAAVADARRRYRYRLVRPGGSSDDG